MYRGRGNNGALGSVSQAAEMSLKFLPEWRSRSHNSH